eukprot:GSChrysophyteH1.ASY1.ANO1.1494.1 assembled CDS
MNKLVSRRAIAAVKVVRSSYSASARSLKLHDNAETIGFIGLGHMGSKMVANMSNDGKNLMVFDMSAEAVSKVTGESNAVAATTVEEIGEKSSQYSSQNKQFIASPVFARPDGISKRQATWMIAGEENGRAVAAELLESSGNCVDYGDDTGASNVVKLCGNFLIASTIEGISEAMALSEKHGVDRKAVMQMLSGSIFDCLIYKGYGQRVSERDHRPGGFSLELGLKDCTLVNAAAREVDVPMPFLSVLLDRYTSAKAKGRADFDWSAIGLSVAEDAGIDVSADVERTRKDVDSGNLY